MYPSIFYKVAAANLTAIGAGVGAGLSGLSSLKSENRMRAKEDSYLATITDSDRKNLINSTFNKQRDVRKSYYAKQALLNAALYGGLGHGIGVAKNAIQKGSANLASKAKEVIDHAASRAKEVATHTSGELSTKAKDVASHSSEVASNAAARAGEAFTNNLVKGFKESRKGMFWDALSRNRS